MKEQNKTKSRVMLPHNPAQKSQYSDTNGN